jgi:hypothetical protein
MILCRYTRLKRELLPAAMLLLLLLLLYTLQKTAGTTLHVRPLTYTIPKSYNEWSYCHFHLRSSGICHSVAIYCRECKITKLRFPPIAQFLQKTLLKLKKTTQILKGHTPHTQSHTHTVGIVML